MIASRIDTVMVMVMMMVMMIMMMVGHLGIQGLLVTGE